MKIKGLYWTSLMNEVNVLRFFALLKMSFGGGKYKQGDRTLDRWQDSCHPLYVEIQRVAFRWQQCKEFREKVDRSWTMIAEKVDKGFILSYQFRCHIYLYELPPEDVSSYRSKMYHLIGVRCSIFQRTLVYLKNETRTPREITSQGVLYLTNN